VYQKNENVKRRKVDTMRCAYMTIIIIIDISTDADQTTVCGVRAETERKKIGPSCGRAKTGDFTFTE